MVSHNFREFVTYHANYNRIANNVCLIISKNNRSNTNHFYIVHEDTVFFACAKGQPTKEATRLRLECPKQIEDDLKSMRDEFLLNKKSQMLVIISMATDEMIQLVAMYPDVWFMDTTAGKCVYFPCI
jgi:hypothetical protein